MRTKGRAGQGPASCGRGELQEWLILEGDNVCSVLSSSSATSHGAKIWQEEGLQGEQLPTATKLSHGVGGTCPQHPLRSLRSLCGCAPRAHTCVLLPEGGSRASLSPTLRFPGLLGAWHGALKCSLGSGDGWRMQGMGPWGAGGGDKAHPEHVEAFCPIRAGCGHVSYHVCHKSFVLGLLLSSSVGVFGGCSLQRAWCWSGAGQQVFAHLPFGAMGRSVPGGRPGRLLRGLRRGREGPSLVARADFSSRNLADLGETGCYCQFLCVF